MMHTTRLAGLTIVLFCLPIDATRSRSDVEVVSYRGDQVFEIQTQTQSDVDAIVSLRDSVDYWKLYRIVGANATACVEPRFVDDFKHKLWSHHIAFSTLILDLGEVFAIEQSKKKRSCRSTQRRSWISFESYARHGQINAYLDELATTYPSLVKVESRSVTPENRRNKYIRISNSARGTAKDRTIFIDAGIHAREWIAPATALFVIHQLVENAARNQDLLDQFDWVVLPCANPDGYEYSHTKVYHQFYLTLHSYGQLLLYPWSYTSELPSTWRDLDEVARAGANAIKAFTGTEYTVGSSTNALYAASGSSPDYAFAVMKIPISLSMELKGGGTSGFDLPAGQIRAVVEESWTGIRAMALNVGAMYESGPISTATVKIAAESNS